MINFTVGPVQSNKKILEIGGEQVPYFRTSEFSDIMFENERLILKFAKAPLGSKAVFVTGSGTASMEATVVNTLTNKDKALVVNGGSFGARFVELLKIHNISYVEIKLEYGKALTEDMLRPFEKGGFTAFLVNVHETSTGVHYDMDLISSFCNRNNLFLIVDAISSFMADELDMQKSGIGVMITGSQKALACNPGVSVIVLSPIALKRIEGIDAKCMYLNLKYALSNAERGQTPFTPAVNILRQIHERLKEIDANGGVEEEIKKTTFLAAYFREKIKDFPFEIVSESLSNAVTPLHPLNVSAYDIFVTLKDEYGIWVCPNGGEMRDTIFRVGHIGCLTVDDYDLLISALRDMQNRELL